MHEKVPPFTAPLQTNSPLRTSKKVQFLYPSPLVPRTRFRKFWVVRGTMSSYEKRKAGVFYKQLDYHPLAIHVVPSNFEKHLGSPVVL